MKEPFTYFRIVIASLLYYDYAFRFVSKSGKLFQSKACSNDFGKNICENIKESADSKYRANILYSLLVFSPKPLLAKSQNFTGAQGSICAITMLSFSSIGSAV